MPLHGEPAAQLGGSGGHDLLRMRVRAVAGLSYAIHSTIMSSVPDRLGSHRCGVVSIKLLMRSEGLTPCCRMLWEWISESQQSGRLRTART
jgi:hypothetical protein